MKYGIIPTNVAEWLALHGGAVPVPVVDALFPLMKTRAIMAGVRLGIFAALADRARTTDDLAAHLGLDAECLELLLRTLAASDYLVLHDGRYALSRLSRTTMVPGGSMELFGYVEWNYTQWDLIGQLENVVRTGRGVDFHETMTEDAAWRHYQRGMMELARIDAPLIAARVAVNPGATSLLDLAGSHGLIGAAICRKHPPMRSTVIDLPAAIAHARELATTEAVADIVDHRPGDIMKDDLGPPADVVVLSNILHHFTPERNAALLSRVRAVTKSGGTVVVWEIEAPTRHSKVTPGDPVALFFRLTSSACAYHGSEYAAWLRAAGFDETKIQRPITRPGSVLVTARAAKGKRSEGKR